jgi:hypothetical protein
MGRIDRIENQEQQPGLFDDRPLARECFHPVILPILSWVVVVVVAVVVAVVQSPSWGLGMSLILSLDYRRNDD